MINNVSVLDTVHNVVISKVTSFCKLKVVLVLIGKFINDWDNISELISHVNDHIG